MESVDTQNDLNLATRVAWTRFKKAQVILMVGGSGF